MECLRDHTGKISNIRIMSFVSLFASIYFTFLTIKLNSEIGSYLIPMYLLAAFMPKSIQKYIELNIPKEK